MREKEIDEKEVFESVKEIDDKLKTEKDAEKRTTLMFEQMLRGIKLTNGYSMF